MASRAERVRRVPVVVGRRLAARVRNRGRPAPGWTLRLTVAAVASYLTAQAAFPHSSPPLLAPLTALLVVQLTPVSLLVSGLDRVVSVVAGVGLAVVLSSAIGLTWWSLGLLIGISLVVAQVLRLGANLLEVPISAMLVLGVGGAGAEAFAGQRIAETLVGAAVGILSNLLFPPRVVALDAATAIEGVAENLARLLREAGDELASDRAEGSWLAERAEEWLGRARQLTHDMPNVGAALLRAEESRRLNLRAVGTPDAGPGLRQGLEALEHCSVAVRSMFAQIEGIARRRADEGRPFDPQLRGAFGLVLDELATGLISFGHLVREEAQPGTTQPDMDAVRTALDSLHEARTRIIDLMLVDARDDLSLGEMVVALGGTVERVLRELDLDERVRRSAGRTARRPTPLSRMHLTKVPRPKLPRAKSTRARRTRPGNPPRDPPPAT